MNLYHSPCFCHALDTLEYDRSFPVRFAGTEHIPKRVTDQGKSPGQCYPLHFRGDIQIA